MFEKIKKEKNDIDPEKLFCAKTYNKTTFNFNIFKTSLDLASDVYCDKKVLKDAESKQHDMQVLLKKLDDYSPANSKKIKERETTINAATNLYNNRQKVIEAFKKGIFWYIDGFEKEEESEEESEKESKKESKEEETKNRTEKFIECIEKK